MKCHDGQKASFSSFQQIYFGHVKALPYSTALVCFCDSLYRTSESLRVRLSVVCYAGAFTTSSLCAWYQRAASGCATQELVEWKGLPWNNRPTHCLLLLEGGKKTAAVSYSSSPLFPLSCAFVCCFCYISTLLWLIFSWARWWKCAIPVRQTPKNSATRQPDHLGPHSRMPF